MGIHLFFDIFKDISKHITWAKLRGLRIAVDASTYLYSVSLGLNHIDTLTTSVGQPTAFLNSIFSFVIRCNKFNIVPVFVFDGAPSELKSKVVSIRKQRREIASKTLSDMLIFPSSASASTSTSTSTPLDVARLLVKGVASEMASERSPNLEIDYVPVMYYHILEIPKYTDDPFLTQYITKLLTSDYAVIQDRTCVSSNIEYAIRSVYSTSSDHTGIADKKLIVYAVNGSSLLSVPKQPEIFITTISCPAFRLMVIESLNDIMSHSDLYQSTINQLKLKTKHIPIDSIDSSQMPIIPSRQIDMNIYQSLVVRATDITEEPTEEIIEQFKALKAKEAFSIDARTLEETKFLLSKLGITYITARDGYEAEQLASQLAIDGIVNAVYTSDADALVFGAPLLIRRMPKGKMELYSLQELLTKHSITRYQLANISVSLGSDYAEKTPRIGAKTYTKAIDGSVLTAEQVKARNYFLIRCPYSDTEFIRGEIDIAGAIEWLVSKKDFNRDRLLHLVSTKEKK